MKTTLALLALLAGSTFAQAGITVTGTGKVKYLPDIAHVSIGVQYEDRTANGAWQKNAEAVKKIFAVLKSLGIADRDLQTTGVKVDPKYTHPRDMAPQLVGYVASYELTITVRKMDTIGKVLDAAVEAGANRSVGIRFACSDPDRMLDDARKAAVADARKKAQLYVTGAGAQLGLVQSISEGSYHPYRDHRFEMAPGMKLAGQPLPIAAGEQELSISVTLTYGIVHGSGPGA